VNKLHPSLYTLLTEFLKEQDATENTFAVLELGRQVRVTTKEVCRCNGKAAKNCAGLRGVQREWRII